MGQFALLQLPSPLRGNAIFIQNDGPTHFEGCPVIDLRTFCAVAPPAETVIYAARDPQLLAALAAIGQSRVLDIRPIFESSTRRQAGVLSSKLAVVSTVPRSGTFRMRYFFYALNETLKGSPPPSAHKLYLYHLSQWTNPDSRYHLGHVFQFLEVDELRIGHFMPPGALATLSTNEAVASHFDKRAANFRRACEQFPCLAATSFPFREPNFEPPYVGVPAPHTRFALLARDIIDQLISMICIFEMSVHRLRRSGPVSWTLTKIATLSTGRFRPFVLHLLDGLMPIIMQRALASDKMVVDIIVEEGHLDSMIIDFALQTYGCDCVEAQRDRNVCAKRFSYDDMMCDERHFFANLLGFLRSGPMSAVEEACVEIARVRTSQEATLRMEQCLGHPISHNERILDIFDGDSHLTSGANRRDVYGLRAAVATRVQHHASAIRSKYDSVLSEFCAGSPSFRSTSTRRAETQGS
jgi:hypothetical protein